MIWIIGGTGETGCFLKKWNNRIPVVVSVATEEGRAGLQGGSVVVARLDRAAMVRFIEDRNIAGIVDLSHPYAVEVSCNARQAADICRIAYFRYSRKTADVQGAIVCSGLDDCLRFLRSIAGTVFFTTGSKNIPEFQKVCGKNRFVYRILPVRTSIETCIEYGVPLRNIVALLGPLSKELNIALFREYGADYVVMKNAGKEGGTPEKIAACAQLGIRPVVIDREQERGYTDWERLLDDLLRLFGKT